MHISGLEAQPGDTGGVQSCATDIGDYFHPRGVVFIGSIEISPFTIKRNARFGCPVCYVNPRAEPRDDAAIYRSLADAPDPLDLAVIRVGARRAAQVVEECAQRGIRNVLLFSNGFSEIGGEGVEYERQLIDAIRRTGVRAIGPNTNENAFESLPLPPGFRGGKIGLITQSGFQGRAVIEGTAIGAGFSRWVPTGNEAGLDAADMVAYFAQDADTASIAAYIEGFQSAGKLRAALRIANERHKPVVMLKIGATERGAKMATSHTGHLTGSNAVIDGLFKQYGVTRVHDLDELLETANLFAKFPQADKIGARCALYSVSGGSVTLMAEAADTYGIEVPTLTKETQEAIAALFPPYLSVSNPIDNGGAFLRRSPVEHRIEVLNLIAADPNIDIVIVGVSGAYPGLSDPFSADLLAWAPTAKKPVIATWNSPQMNTEAYDNVLRSGTPIFRSFRGCFQALRAYADYGKALPAFRDRETSAAALTKAEAAALEVAGTIEARAAAAMLKAADIDLVRERLVHSAQEAAATAREFGLPVVMKLMSPAFPHKSDLGLVRLGIDSAEAAAAVHDELVSRARALDPGAVIDGVAVQEQIGKGVEMIVGLSQDPQFGPVLTIGAGGIYAEILKDVSVRPLPVDRQDILEMIGELKLSPLLDGVRGAPPADKDSLVDLALAVARLGLKARGRLSELDLNPVIALPDRAVAVDVLAVAGTPDECGAAD